MIDGKQAIVEFLRKPSSPSITKCLVMGKALDMPESLFLNMENGQNIGIFSINLKKEKH